MGKKKNEMTNVKKNKKKKGRSNLMDTTNNRVGYFIKRGFAFGFDWYLSSVLANLAISFANMMFQNQLEVVSDVNAFTFGQSLIMWLMVLLTALFYYVFIPTKIWQGQTPIQRMMQIRVVKLDGGEVDWKTMMFRFVVGCLLIEASLYSCSSILLEIIMSHLLASVIEVADLVVGTVFAIVAVASCVLALLDKKNNQTLHDRIAGTKVIDFFDPNAPSRVL